METKDLCPSGLRVTMVQPVMCTHGPDVPPLSLAVHRPVAPMAPLAGAASAGPRALAVCEGDGNSGRRVEVVYVHGNVNRALGDFGAIVNAIKG